MKAFLSNMLSMAVMSKIAGTTMEGKRPPHFGGNPMNSTPSSPFRTKSSRNQRSKAKRGMTERQLHAKRYPVMQLHPQITLGSLNHWMKPHDEAAN